MQEYSLNIEPWQPAHDCASFSTGMASIDRYLKELAHRDISSRSSFVFVLTEPGEMIARGYYSLSSAGISFDELPKATQRKLPRYPQVSATLLGRLGVDRNYSRNQERKLGKKPRLGELLLMDAQKKTLQIATSTQGSAIMLIDVEKPKTEELKKGIRDPLDFYTQYGFIPFPSNERRLFKLTRTIEAEF